MKRKKYIYNPNLGAHLCCSAHLPSWSFAESFDVDCYQILPLYVPLHWKRLRFNTIKKFEWQPKMLFEIWEKAVENLDNFHIEMELIAYPNDKHYVLCPDYAIDRLFLNMVICDLLKPFLDVSIKHLWAPNGKYSYIFKMLSLLRPRSLSINGNNNGCNGCYKNFQWTKPNDFFSVQCRWKAAFISFAFVNVVKKSFWWTFVKNLRQAIKCLWVWHLFDFESIHVHHDSQPMT